MKLRNLTPHPLDIYHDDTYLTVPPESGPTPQVVETTDPHGHIDTVSIGGIDVPVLRVTAHCVTGLPRPQAGTLLVVARVVADSAPERDDLVVPYEPVRNTHGAIVGCRSLARIVATRDSNG